MLVGTPAAGANVMEMALCRRQLAEPILKLPCTSSVVSVRFSGASSITSCTAHRKPGQGHGVRRDQNAYGTIEVSREGARVATLKLGLHTRFRWLTTQLPTRKVLVPAFAVYHKCAKTHTWLPSGTVMRRKREPPLSMQPESSTRVPGGRVTSLSAPDTGTWLA